MKRCKFCGVELTQNNDAFWEERDEQYCSQHCLNQHRAEHSGEEKTWCKYCHAHVSYESKVEYGGREFCNDKCAMQYLFESV